MVKQLYIADQELEKMKLSLKELIGYSIETLDGSKGKIKDFLFDEERWVIRYVDIDLGKLSPGRRVLIPRMFFKKIDSKNGNLMVQINKSDVERCNQLEGNLPVSRKYEQELNMHYNIPNYWTGEHKNPDRNTLIEDNKLPQEVEKLPGTMIREEDIDTNLRSYKEVIGYTVKTLDGHLGKIDDLLIDSNDWSMISAIINIENSLFLTNQVIIAIVWTEEISYVDRTFTVNLTTKDIMYAPPFDAADPVNEVYEKKLFDYYGRPAERERES